MPLDEFKTQVLLLHSDRRALDSLGSCFNDCYTVHYATSGSQALNALAEVPINVIISAHDLPGMSGLEALREAKKRSPETYAILLTGNDDKEVEALVGDEEIFQVVRGTIDEASLLELVETATRELRLTTLSNSANDTMAHADTEAEQIVMETADDGSSIISQTSVRLRALNPNSFAKSVPVHVLVLTMDDEFLETVRSSAGSTHKVHTATRLADAGAIIREHEVGVAIVDAAIVRGKIEQLTQYLRRESPRLVSIVAGRREDGEMLMDLINRGKVYRFLLKPVSSGRARLAVEASVKRHLEAPDTAFISQDEETAAAPANGETTADGSDGSPEQDTATAPAIIEAETTGDVAEALTEAPAVNDADARAQIEPLLKTNAFHMAELARAASMSAESAHRFVKLPVVGAAVAVVAIIIVAAYFWVGRPAQDSDTRSAAIPATAGPSVAAADVSFSPQNVERLLNHAETALLESRLTDADDALKRVTILDPANARLPFLTAQLLQAQLRVTLTDARAAIRDGRFEDAADALSAAQALGPEDTSEIDTLAIELDTARNNRQTDDVLALANARLESGDLLTPANSNARYYYELVLANDPENTSARQGLDIIASRLVLQARSEIDNGNYNSARKLLDDARAIDSTNEEIVATSDALQLARKAAANKAAAARAAANKAAAERAAARKAAAEKAAAEQAAAEQAAAEKAAVEKAAADRASQQDDVEMAVESPAAESDSAQAAGTAASNENSDTEGPGTDPAAAVTQANAIPTAVSSLVRTNYVAPKFPRSAVRRNQSGWVDLAFTVSADGSVKDIAVRGSEPGDLFIPSATRAVEQWQFEPVLENGVVIEKRAAVRMMFSLD